MKLLHPLGFLNSQLDNLTSSELVAIVLSGGQEVEFEEIKIIVVSVANLQNWSSDRNDPRGPRGQYFRFFL